MQRIQLLVALLLVLTSCNSSNEEPFTMPAKADDKGLVIIPGKVLFQGNEMKPDRITIDIVLTDSSYTYTIKTYSK